MSKSKSTAVRVDQHLCCASGLCVRELPELFRFREGIKRADVVSKAVPAHLVQRVRLVAERCPGRAIILLEPGISAPR